MFAKFLKKMHEEKGDATVLIVLLIAAAAVYFVAGRKGPRPKEGVPVVQRIARREEWVTVYAEKGKEYSPSPAVERIVPLTSGEGNDIQAICSPDGRDLAFTSDRLGNQDVFVIDLAALGKAAAQKTFIEPNDFHPAWSPDQKSLVFASDRIGVEKIFRVDLTRFAPKMQMTRGVGRDKTPCYSPDGRKIVYSSRPATPLGLPYIWIINLDTNDMTQYVSGYEPSFSPDGKRVLFESKKAGNSDIWILDLTTGDQVQITSDPSDDFDPAWSPDGELIAFASNRPGNSDIWVMKSDGSNLTRITTHPEVDRYPTWSADGDKIYFSSYRNGNYDLFEVGIRIELIMKK
ncbi:hypothetical protein E3J48_00695 [Candidatus Aerophobetes bacterium]|uniref:DUF5050 domain-containing protein n=1 Tax=Aerophobetes bacterium TaxID=2030807 RepID=A0A523WCJ3_UNCAE|nr:MAG: hypothetical protein E3J48_00695 [Candidatus Aerophobetes bacterium]